MEASSSTMAFTLACLLIHAESWLSALDQTVDFRRSATFGGMDAPDAHRLRELEGENAKPKKLLAEAHLDMHALKSVLVAKRWPHRSNALPSGR